MDSFAKIQLCSLLIIRFIRVVRIIGSLIRMTALIVRLLQVVLCLSAGLIDAPSPEGRAKNLGEDDVGRIVLIA